jgi:hypothetical protein
MPINQESLQDQLYDFLKSQGYKPIRYNSSGKTVPLSKLADVFKFDFKMDDTVFGPLYAAVIGKDLFLWTSDDIEASPRSSETGDLSLRELKNWLKNWAHDHQLGWEIDDISNLEDEMAKREDSKNLSEGYYPLGKKLSYNDSVPNVKIKIQHSREILEGEQRFRNVEKIYLETIEGERFLLNTRKPGIARVYARHICEGGKINDDRWNHISNIVEEYSNIAGFVRATKNKQFNESTQPIVNEGVNHYFNLRETLQKLSGKKGYTKYFESWNPTLQEDTIGQPDLAEMFMSSSIDPRIEKAMPVLAKISKKIKPIDEVIELEEWTDSVISEKLVPHGNDLLQDLADQFNEPIPFGDEGINVKNLLAKFKLEDDDLNDLLTKSSEVGSDADARPIILDFIKNAKKHDLHKLANLIEPKLVNPEQLQPVAENIDDEQLIETIIKLAIEGHTDPKIAKELNLKLEDVQQILDAFIEDIEAGIDQTVDESLNQQQTKAKQLGPTEKAKGISPVLGKEPKQHPFKGKLVGASESVDPIITRMKKLSGLDK